MANQRTVIYWRDEALAAQGEAAMLRALVARLKKEIETLKEKK
jgi:hypothetical protein